MKLREWMTLNKWTGEELAEELDISVNYVYMLCNGSRSPSKKLINKIHKFTNGFVNFSDWECDQITKRIDENF